MEDGLSSYNWKRRIKREITVTKRLNVNDILQSFPHSFFYGLYL